MRLPKACRAASAGLGMTHKCKRTMASPGRVCSQAWGTAMRALAEALGVISSGAMGRMKVQLTNSVCISQRKRKAPKSARTCAADSAGGATWWFCISWVKCARLCWRWASLASITTWVMAMRVAKGSGGRACTSLCNCARKAWSAILSFTFLRLGRSGP